MAPANTLVTPALVQARQLPPRQGRSAFPLAEAAIKRLPDREADIIAPPVQDMVMKKNPVALIIIGLLLLAGGMFMQFNGGAPKADSALAQWCRDEMKGRGADASMADRCSETAFATAMTATDAQSAARGISAANNREVGGNALAMFLIGLGLVLTIGGVVLRGRKMA